MCVDSNSKRDNVCYVLLYFNGGNKKLIVGNRSRFKSIRELQEFEKTLLIDM